MVAAPILAYIIAHPDLGWRWAFGFLGLVGLVWTVLWAMVFKEGPYSHFNREETDQKLQAVPVVYDPNCKSIVKYVDVLKTVPIFKIFFSFSK